MTKISVIIPCFNEQGNIDEMYQRVKKVADNNKYELECIFIDDHSSDNSPKIIKEIHQEDKRVKMLRFARNHGCHSALSAGLSVCTGDCAVVIAADLQDPPEIIPQMVQQWQMGNKIVWAVRSKREGESFFTKLFSQMYYMTINSLTTVKMPDLGADVFLADRAAIDAYKLLPEKHTSIFMAFAWLGFQQAQITYVKEARHQGLSGWTLGKKIKLLIDSIVSFSDVPIRVMSALGFVIAFLGFLYAIHVFYNYLLGSPVEGWTSLTVFILVIGGVQMMMLGVLGEYLWRTFDESRRRPRYIIEEKVGVDG